MLARSWPCLMTALLIAGIAAAEEPSWTVGTAEQLERTAAEPIGINDRAACVRLAKPPKIDGNLQDWAGVPACVSFPMPALKDSHRAELRFACDNEALYVGMHVTDTTPLVNARPPLGGDAIRIGIAAGQTAIATFAKSDDSESVGFSSAGSGTTGGSISVSATATASGAGGGAAQGGGITVRTSVDGNGASRQAWLKDADGPRADGSHGYSFEASIPWQAIGIKPDKLDAPDAAVRWTVEIRWGDKTGTIPALICRDGLMRHVAGGEDPFTDPSLWGTLRFITEAEAKKASAPGKLGLPEIAYTLAENAFVSIVIDGADGRRVRNLIAENPRLAGKRRELWDARDDAGRLVPPGTLRWRGVRHAGLEPHYLMSYNNPGQPPYITDNASSWGADHDVPRQVACGSPAGDSLLYLGWNNCEAGSSLIAVNQDGRKIWGWRASLAAGWNLEGMTANGKYVFLAKSGWGWGRNDQHGSHLIRFDGASGRAVDWPRENGGVGEGVLTVRDWAPEEKDKGPRLNGVSIDRAGTLYLSLLRENIVEMRDSETGAVTGKLDVPEPGGSAIDAAGRLLVISGSKLLRIDPKTRKQEPLHEFGRPENVAVDQTGRIFVSDWATMQVIEVGADGVRPGGMTAAVAHARVPLHIGRTGGRQTAGAWQNDGMLKPEGIAIDPQGRLWVAEADSLPKRFSVWNRDGKFAREFVGPSFYGGTTGYFDPDDPTIAYASSTKFKLDYKTRSYKPIASLGRNDRPGAVFWDNVEGHFYKLNGNADGIRRYFVSKGGAYSILTVFAVEPDRLRALAAIGTVGSIKDRFIGEQAARKPPQKITGAKDTDWFSWSDRNGDALVQDDELQVIASPTGSGFGTYWGGFPDSGLNFYMPTSCYRFVIWKWPVTGWTDCGAPIYDLTKAREFARYPGDGFESHVGFIGADSSGRVLIRGNPIMAFKPDGTVDWTYPGPYAVHGSGAPPPAPGLIIEVHMIPGVAPLTPSPPLQAWRGGMGGEEAGGGDIFAMNGNDGEWYFMTTDGVFVHHIFKDFRVGGHKGPEYVISQESFGGDFCRAADGNYYVVAGHTDNRVFRITGIDSIRRFAPKQFELTAEHYAAAQKRMADEQFAAKADKTVRVPRLASDRSGRQPPADGFVQDWPDGSLVEWTALNGSTVGVRKAWTPEALHLRYDVQDSSPLKNSGENVQMLFKYGDSVDLQLAGDQKADANRPQPVTGDLRLLMTEARGKAFAVLYEPEVPGIEKGVGFASPWRSVNIDRVSESPDVRLRVTRRERDYSIEAVVPWTVLGVKPAQGMRLRGDFGVLFGNDAGEITTLRSYWSNQNTSIVSDVPSEASLEPRQWGTFVLE